MRFPAGHPFRRGAFARFCAAWASSPRAPAPLIPLRVESVRRLGHLSWRWALARAALREGGGAPCVMNAANEEAVYAFLRGDISFGSIYDIVRDVTEIFRTGQLRCFEDVRECDGRARILARERIKAIQ